MERTVRAGPSPSGMSGGNQLLDSLERTDSSGAARRRRRLAGSPSLARERTERPAECARYRYSVSQTSDQLPAGGR